MPADPDMDWTLTHTENALLGKINACSFEMDDRSRSMMTRALASNRRDTYIDALRIIREARLGGPSSPENVEEAT
jgi:hypothetical protein